jgi:hypothetical protein
MTRTVPRQSLRRDDDISGICFFTFRQNAPAALGSKRMCLMCNRFPAVPDNDGQPSDASGPVREELFPFLRV